MASSFASRSGQVPLGKKVVGHLDQCEMQVQLSSLVEDGLRCLLLDSSYAIRFQRPYDDVEFRMQRGTEPATRRNQHVSGRRGGSGLGQSG